MSMKHPLIPKGSAQSLHLTKEYKEGQKAESRSENPYEFYDQYNKHYAWDIGNQERDKSRDSSYDICEKCHKIKCLYCVCTDC